MREIIFYEGTLWEKVIEIVRDAHHVVAKDRMEKNAFRVVSMNHIKIWNQRAKSVAVAAAATNKLTQAI